MMIQTKLFKSLKVKLFLSLVSLFTILSLSSSAQFNVGFSTGLIGSQVSGDGIYGFNQFGLRVGAASRISFKKNWGMSIGIFYSQKGSRKWSSKTSFYEYRLRIHYIDVPVLASYQLKSFLFRLGPSINTYVGHKERDSYGTINANRSFKRFELSVDAFIDYFFTDHFWVGLHFSNSVTPIRPHSAGQSYKWNLGQYNTLLSLNLGYLLKPFNSKEGNN